MEKRRLGRTDIEVSALCLGTMMYGDQIKVRDAQMQMDACADRGINFFDTAELYTIPPKPKTQGESERIVGQWMAERGVRDKIILATKVVGRTSMNWFREGGAEVRMTADQITFAVERSLKNLQTDYLDLYQIHWPDRKVSVFGENMDKYTHYSDDYISYEETLGAMKDLQDAGKIRHFGLSNETPYGTMRFLNVAETKNWPRVQSIQNAYNFLNRGFEHGLAEIAMEEQVGLLAYSPMAQGALSGKYLDGAKPAGSRGALFGRLGRYETPIADKAIRAYLDLAKEIGVDPSALATQFVTTRKFVTSNIFGVSTMEQLETVFQSQEIMWTDEIDQKVNAIHLAQPNPCP